MKLEDAEKNIIMEALRFYGGNKTHVANGLDIAYRTLTDKLKKYEDKEQEIKNLEEERKRRRNEAIQTERKFFMEQNARISAQQPVPVPERKEVQKVPLSDATTGSTKSKNKFK